MSEPKITPADAPAPHPPPHLVEGARRLETILRRRDPKHAWIVEVKTPDEIREREASPR